MSLSNVVNHGHLRLVKGPRENRSRPAIDPLFRSAAVAYGPRVIGIVLSGMLDDGAARLAAVKRCGGIAIVQDPDDAIEPDMPRNALAATEVDYCVSVVEMGDLVSRLVREPASAKRLVPDDLILEARILAGEVNGIKAEDQLGKLVPSICPECSGPLWQLADGRRYRYHVGHAFTVNHLLHGQDDKIEESLWAAARTMEERTQTLKTLARQQREHGRDKSAAIYEERAEESTGHARHLRELLTKRAV